MTEAWQQAALDPNKITECPDCGGPAYPGPNGSLDALTDDETERLLDGSRATLRRALRIIAQHHAVGKHAGSPCTDCGEEGPCEYAAWWAEASASVGGVKE